jgi:hypothetical protein
MKKSSSNLYGLLHFHISSSNSHHFKFIALSDLFTSSIRSLSSVHLGFGITLFIANIHFKILFSSKTSSKINSSNISSETITLKLSSANNLESSYTFNFILYSQILYQIHAGFNLSEKVQSQKSQL